MKLLYCYNCGDIFNLSVKGEKQCSCGTVKGGYIDYRNAVTNGKGACIAIGNGSFEHALYELYSAGNEMERDDYKNICRVEYCWVRPHEGTGNPNSKVENDEER